jgi:hypothetical protein
MCSNDLKPYKLEGLTFPALDILIIYDDVYRIWQTFFRLLLFFILSLLSWNKVKCMKKQGYKRMEEDSTSKFMPPLGVSI